LTDCGPHNILSGPSGRQGAARSLEMAETGIKETAESALRELPGVVGAFVLPDTFGHPREIHLLIKPGPPPRDFAVHVKSVLESRLRMPIDQRIISIAQLAEEKTTSLEPEPTHEPEQTSRPREEFQTPRFRLQGVESEVAGSYVTVRVRLSHDEGEMTGEATELESGDGRARAAAIATLNALNSISGRSARFGLDFAVQVLAVGQPYILVTIAVTSPQLGRRSVPLAGAHPLEDDLETAASLAVLKATNRLLGFLLGRRPRNGRTLKG
jgi:hypothetical protein